MAARAFVDALHGGVTCSGELDAADGVALAKGLGSPSSSGSDRTSACSCIGGYGYMMEYPIAELYVDARVQRIYGGTNEIMKELASRSM